MKKHVIINRDRTVVVPESLKKIGIQFDHNVNTITFDCPRYPDEDSSIDMSQMPIFINYMLPDKTPGSSLALNVTVDETDDTLIHFDWKITNAITPVNGVLSTLICVKQSDTEGNELYHWNTDLFQKFTVGNGMECNGQVAEMNPDVISQLLARMGEVDTRTSTEAMSGYVNEYMTKNPPQPTDEQVGSGVNAYMTSNGQTHVNAYMTENQELVQNSVDDYLGRNPLQLDETLTDSTKAAPADLVGELKGDIVNHESMLLSIFVDVETFSHAGYLSINGEFFNLKNTCSKHTKRIGCIPGDKFSYIGVGNGSAASWLFYNGNTIISYGQYNDTTNPAEVIIPDGIDGVVFASYVEGTDVSKVVLSVKQESLTEKSRNTIRENLGIRSDSELADMFVSKVVVQSENLFNKGTAVIGEYWSGSSKVNASDTYGHSGPTKLPAGSYVCDCSHNIYGSNSSTICVVDKDDNFLRNLQAEYVNDDKSLMRFTLSSECFVDFNLAHGKLDTVMLVRGDSAEDYPTSYIPYYLKIEVESGVHLNEAMKEDIKKLSAENPLSGKKLAVDGDSICSGAGYSGGYAKIIGENNRMAVQNIGVGGGTICAETYSGTTPRHWICRTMANIDDDADYIIIEGGVNDSVTDRIGEISAGFNATLDETTFYGAVESVFKQLTIRFAGKKYGFIIVHQMESSMYPGGVRYNAIKQCAEKWCVPLLDLSVVVPPFNRFRAGNELDNLRIAYTMDGDGWHPNEDGYRKYYVPKIEAWLKTL